MVLLGILSLALINLPRPDVGASLFGAALLAYLSGCLLAFFAGGFLMPMAAPFIAASLSAGTGLAGRVVFAEQDKRRLHQRFAGAMSPERLQVVMDNWEALLQNERPRKEAAVLFADIRGFTYCTETLLDQGRSTEMVQFLSAYLDAMEDAVFPHGGVIFDNEVRGNLWVIPRSFHRGQPSG